MGQWPDRTNGERFFPHSHALRGHAGQPGPRAENRERGFRSQQHVRCRLRGSQRVLLIDRRPVSAATGSATESCPRHFFSPCNGPTILPLADGVCGGVPDYPMPITENHQPSRRKLLSSNEFQVGDSPSQRGERGLSLDRLVVPEKLAKTLTNIAIHRHIFHPDLLVRCRIVFGLGRFWASWLLSITYRRVSDCWAGSAHRRKDRRDAGTARARVIPLIVTGFIVTQFPV